MDTQYVKTTSKGSTYDVQLSASTDDGHLLSVVLADEDSDVDPEVTIPVGNRDEVEALRAGLNKALDDLAATFS